MMPNPFMMMGGGPGPGMPGMQGPMFPGMQMPGMPGLPNMQLQGLGASGPGAGMEPPPPPQQHQQHQQQQQRTQGGSEGLKTRLCNKFMQTGSCSYGDTCKFAHGHHELRDGQQGQQGQQQQQQQPQQQQHQGPHGGGPGGQPDRGEGARGKAQGSNMRKTRLCDKFMMMGHCPYGDKCTFAHGADELRNPPPREADTFPVPGPAPPPDPYPGAAPKAPAIPPGAATVAAANPQSRQQSEAAPGPSGAAPAATKPEVTFVDKVRAICGVLNIGNAATLSKDKPLALQTAAMSLRNGNAFKDNPFADSVEHYMEAA